MQPLMMLVAIEHQKMQCVSVFQCNIIGSFATQIRIKQDNFIVAIFTTTCN